MEFDPQGVSGHGRALRNRSPLLLGELATTLARELALDGAGRLLDVGCGPGVLELELAGLFDFVVALDPEVGMLETGRRRCADARVENVRWLEGMAEDIPSWTSAYVAWSRSLSRSPGASAPGGRRRLRLARAGGLARPRLHEVSPEVSPRPRPVGPPYRASRMTRYASSSSITSASPPPVPRSVPRGPTGEVRRHFAGDSFRGSRTVYAPGRQDLIRDIDTVVANYFSMSWAAPRLFGDRLADFEADLRGLLSERSPEGLFWDWPGDTELVIATKP